MNRHFLVLLLLFIAVSLFGREKTRINFGWKYAVGSLPGAEKYNYDDSKWQVLNLPHDGSIYGSFIQEDGKEPTRYGYRPRHQGWYRKQIAFEESWIGKRVILEFEGVYRAAVVYVNGKACGEANKNGYLDFEYDITDKLQKGNNIIAVSYNNLDRNSSRWYSGEGINRDVWLKVVDPLHVDRYGTYITTPVVSEKLSKIDISTEVRNDAVDSALCRLITEIHDIWGHIVARQQAVAPVAAGEVMKIQQQLSVTNAILWCPENPYLYTAVSKVYCGDRHVDTYETPFGIRHIEMNPEQGLLVNGKKVFLRGVCLHTDLGPLGTASFTAGWDQRLQTVVNDLGCNAIRLSHNNYPQYVLDWCDRHGILVFDEFTDKWDESLYGAGTYYGEHLFQDLGIQIRRDRNHPSVFIWSVGNELEHQYQRDKLLAGGVEKLKRLVDFVHKFEPSRMVTVGEYPARFNAIKWNETGYNQSTPNQYAFYSDVMSVNYMESFFKADHELYPQLIFMVSEMTTGEYGYNYFHYDHSYTCGQFYWGGTEYIGESFGWPSKGWINGLIDLSNHLKPTGWSVSSFYKKSPVVKLVVLNNVAKGSKEWNDAKISWQPMLMHWNFNKDDKLKVQVFSNCDQTELFVNGVSQGIKELPAFPKEPKLIWDVDYIEGEVKAIGYRNGKKTAEDILTTASTPVRLEVECSKKEIAADGLDLCYLNYRLVDRHGTVVPNADRLMKFKVVGAAVNAGVDNGNIESNEPWQSDSRSTFNGRCQLIIRSTGKTGPIRIEAKTSGIKPLITKIVAVDSKQ